MLFAGTVGVLFFRPTWIINPGTIDFVLRKSHVLKSWSWKDADIRHEWRSWNDRIFKGHFTDLCLAYESSSLKFNGCFEEISWDLYLKNLTTHTLKPLTVHSSQFQIEPGPSDGKPQAPPNFWRYWQLLWSDLFPDLDVAFHHIEIKKAKASTKFSFSLEKSQKTLAASVLDLRIKGDPEKLEIIGPDPYELPMKKDFPVKLVLHHGRLVSHIKESGIFSEATGNMNGVRIQVNSKVKLPLSDDLSSTAFLRKLLLGTTAKLSLDQLKRQLTEHVKAPFNVLPAPFNAMDGDLRVNIHSEPLNSQDDVLVKADSEIRLAGGDEVFNLNLSAGVPFNLPKRTPGPIELMVDFLKVALRLPKFSKKELPPQFFPDPRFKHGLGAEKKLPSPPVILEVRTENHPVSVVSNLVDEPIRMKFDFLVSEKGLDHGFVEVLPLKTAVFKRKIRLKDAKITFARGKDSILTANILFLLPEYKITLDLEGPLSRPRQSFSSDPALPEEDILSVLLFGRPRSALSATDKTQAQKSSQVIAQGFFSLSTLYFLAGSPVQYIGYDPESKSATATLSVGRKTSVDVGGGQGGVNSTGVRHSLGKGWYIDSSVDSTTTNTQTSQNSRSYGVLLERVINY